MEKRNQKNPTPAGALWRLESERRGEARAGLTLEAIVEAAVEIADEHGLDRVSMARVAKRLGFTTMALYRHVPNKGELLGLMFDAGVGEPPRSILAASGWRERMHAYAREFSVTFRRRPWLLDIPITGPPSGPNNIRWLDAGLTAMEETGLDIEDRLEAFLTLTSYMLGSQRLEIEVLRAEEAARRAGEPAESGTYGDVLRSVLPPGEFLAVEAAIAAGVFDEEGDPGEELRRGVDYILDGIEALIARRAGSGERVGDGSRGGAGGGSRTHTGHPSGV